MQNSRCKVYKRLCEPDLAEDAVLGHCMFLRGIEEDVSLLGGVLIVVARVKLRWLQGWVIYDEVEEAGWQAAHGRRRCRAWR